MSAALTGLSVLVTRPTPQHNSICAAIRELGGCAFHFPLIEITDLQDEKDIRRCKSKVEHLDNYQIVIFVSNNAAIFGASVINDYWPQFPLGVKVIAIGRSTASKASAELNCKVIHPAQGATSEDVLAMPALADVSDKKVAIIRGQGGRELLAETLRSRGAEVDYLEVYRRSPANNNSRELRQLIESEQLNVFSVTSGESLQRLYALLKEAWAKSEAESDANTRGEQLNGKSPQLAQILSRPLIVPSDRIAAKAQELGFSSLSVALGADVDATIEALQELAK